MTDLEKIDIIMYRLNNLKLIIQSYIDHADIFSNKYLLEDVLPDCNAKKEALLKELNKLGGAWSS